MKQIISCNNIIIIIIIIINLIIIIIIMKEITVAFRKSIILINSTIDSQLICKTKALTLFGISIN